MKAFLSYIFLVLSFISFGQQTKNVDFKTCNAYLSFDVPQKKVMGKVVYTFDVKSKPDTIYIDAKNMKFTNVKINGKDKGGWVASTTALKLFKGYKKGKNTIEFMYEAQPKQTLYFVGPIHHPSGKNKFGEPMVKIDDDLQIWTQGQGKYTSHWLPSFDDVNEKVIFNLNVAYPNDFTVLANGILKDSAGLELHTVWNYKMDKPMSSYLVMLAIGKFRKWKMDSANGTPMEFYLRHEDSLKRAPTYRYSYEMFNYLEEEIGVKYPWGIYRQVPVLDFLYAGMENTTSTIFSQDFVVDETGFNDRNYINVNAHELAHQWFGDLVTAESGTHHWLQEGFATYYALLAERELFGDDHFNYELYEIAERLQQVSKTDTIPILNEKASFLTFYQKGAWALHVLRDGVGEAAFRKAVKTYLERYAYGNVNTDQFLAEIKKVSNYDTAAFKKRWLESSKFEVQEALAILSKNEFMKEYLALGNLQGKPFSENKEAFKHILLSDSFSPIKEEVIFQMAQVPFAEKAELIRIAMKSKNLKQRQAVARTVTTIPPDFLDEYISLLDDNSYITREIALNVLCSKFPERQAEFLEKSKTWVGFSDKNLRVLWLTLAYSAKDYKPERKPDFYAELLQYASPRYESTLRQNALNSLLYIGKQDPIVMENLVNATQHHKWQFAKYGRDNIRKLLKKDGYRGLFTSILPNLPEAERKRLELILAE